MKSASYLFWVSTLSIFIIILSFILSNKENGVPTYAKEPLTSQTFNENYAYDLNNIVFAYKHDPYNPHLANINSTSGMAEISISSLASEAEINAKKPQLENAINVFSHNENILYAQPNYLYSINWTRNDPEQTATPNDFDQSNHWYYDQSNLREMWYLQGCGDTSQKCGGDENIIIAVVDTGLAYEDRTRSMARGTPDNYLIEPPIEVPFQKATDLFGTSKNVNLYTNSGETPNDGIDNDSNGIIDDHHGFDAAYYHICKGNVFVDSGTPYNPCIDYPQLSDEEGHPNDDFGHGTYVTGLIASIVDNSSGSISPAHNIRIMPIKATFNFNSNYPVVMPSLFIAEGIIYAVDNGADVINMSFGQHILDPNANPDDQLVINALIYAHNHDVVLIAASGNDADLPPPYTFSNIGYPAGFDNVIAVGAVNSNDTRSSYSQYGYPIDQPTGPNKLDIVAYVGDFNTNPRGTYQQSYNCFDGLLGPTCGNTLGTDFTQFKTQKGFGTSYASPQVAALAGLILSYNPNLSAQQVEQVITDQAKDINTTGWDEETGWGVIDYYASIDAVREETPDPDLDFIQPDGSDDEDDIKGNYTLEWDLQVYNTDHDYSYSFYLDINSQGADGSLIQECQNLTSTGSGTCTFNSNNFDDNTYYVYSCVEDITSGWSSCDFYASHPLTFTAPSQNNVQIKIDLERKDDDSTDKLRVVLKKGDVTKDFFLKTGTDGLSTPYDISSLEFGDYTVIAKPDDYISQEIKFSLKGGSNVVNFPQAFRVGDINKTSYDFINALDFSLFIKYLREQNFEEGDFNVDGAVNAVDYSILLKTYREKRQGALVFFPEE